MDVCSVDRRHQTSVYTVELYAREDNIKIIGDDTDSRPMYIYGCKRMKLDRIEKGHHIGRIVASIISTFWYMLRFAR